MAKRTARYTAIDLFCGCGGLTVGLKQAGFRVVGAIDLDKLATGTYKENHPEVHVWQQDISTLSSRTLLRTLGLRKRELDLLAGCPPCQGFSSLRTLNGGKRVRDRQNDLIFEFLRLVDELRPRALMLENVPALARNGRLRTFLSTVSSLGYDAHSAVLDAADYGVPQRRHRLILLGSRLGHIPFYPPSGRRRTVRQAIGSLPRPALSRDTLHRLGANHSDTVRALIASIPKNGGSRIDAGARAMLECHKRTQGFYDVYGRMAWEKVAPTITTGCVNPSRGRFLHPRQNRAITLREAALLQTFPNGYSFSLAEGKYGAARLIGNALPPEFIRRHTRAVFAHLEVHRQRER